MNQNRRATAPAIFPNRSPLSPLKIEDESSRETSPTPVILEVEEEDKEGGGEIFVVKRVKEIGVYDVGVWNEVSASKFLVRTLNYTTNSKKAPSSSSLFTPTSILAFKSPLKNPSILSCLSTYTSSNNTALNPCLDNLLKEGIKEVEESVPMLVVNFLLPFEHSYMQDQVGGGQLTYFFEPTPTFISDYESGLGGITAEWLKNAKDDDKLRSRFKVIMQLSDATVLPGAVRKYNGKPVLIQHTGSLKERTFPNGRKFLEMTCDVHGWGTFSRRALVGCLGGLGKMDVECGFLVESRGEGKEQIMGCARVCKIDAEKLVSL